MPTVGMFTETYHPTTNGVVISIDTFAAELRRRGVRVVIFAPQILAACPESDVIRLPALSLPIPHFADYAWVVAGKEAVIDRVRAEKIDILHTHHPFLMGNLALAGARALRLPIVQTYHTLLVEYAHYLKVAQKRVRQFMIDRSRDFSNQMDHVITPSPSIEHLLESYGVHVPITSIPTGLELADFHEKATDNELRAGGIDPAQPFLLFVGRLAHEKNIPRLLETYEWVIKQLPDTEQPQLVLIGDGPLAGKLQAWVRSRRLTRVVFAGRQSKVMTRRFFGRAALFTFPSVTETQGIVIQEALAAGVPIVAVDAFGPGDYVTDGVTGRLVANATAPMAEAILELLDNDALRLKMAAAARREAEKYSVEATTDQVIALYEQLLKQHRRKHLMVARPTAVTKP